MDSKLGLIKKSQKESLLLKEFSNLFLQLCLDHPNFQNLFVTRAELNSNKSVCTFYFYSSEGEVDFKSKLETLKLYKPSIRKSLAQKIKSRYMPDLRFEFDAKFEKEKRVNEILDQVKQEDDS